MKNNNKKTSLIVVILCATTTLFLGITFFAWTMFPYIQMKVFYKNLRQFIHGNPNPLLTSHFSFYPMTSIQPELRHEFINAIFDGYGSKSDVITTIPFVITKLEESVAYAKQYPEHFLALGKAYDYMADIGPADTALDFHQKAEIQFQKATALFPGNQRVMYAYAINLANQGRIEEAIRMVKDALNEDSRVSESHYYLGIVLFKSGTKNYDEALLEIERSLGDTGVPDILVQSIYKKMIPYYYAKQDVEHFTTVLKRLLRNPAPETDYQKIIDFITQNGHLPEITIR